MTIRLDMAGKCFINLSRCIPGVPRAYRERCCSTGLWLSPRRSHPSSLRCDHWSLSTNTPIRCLSSTATVASNQELAVASSSAEQLLFQELGKVASVVKTDILPDEVAIQEALQICENLAKALTEPIQCPGESSKPGHSPTSTLLSLEQESRDITEPRSLKAQPTPVVKTHMADRISMAAYNIIMDPKVFISPTMLSTYVNTQTMLSRPQSFPKVFDLYATKPRPQPGSNPITYKESSSNSASSAVPLPVADSALTTAIGLKDLPLCLSIIDTTVCTTAYKRNKFLRKAMLPMTGLALAPAAAYALATQLAQMQHSMDHQMATQMFFVGIVAYVGFTATIGMVAITTSNDQMDRITWAKGTPLSDRWLREDERALVDRVADAWGFQDISMRGEEEGEEWETLREWAGRRTMVLDNPELMEGME